ncbi:aldehyde dehydrogenase (NADP(+)) [Acinetobacter bereziniae]|uniref:aldehyde dehydrogenase (NADP(+)) n=1 Tax=Acinetobacter bereziniae TaxID=106648 RepID=UPI0018DD6785|nr:aldehyde dehydrogenase (NADP(+)) [Acinetobacter bereziniae]MBI0394151.1 aldehyde dehydrogenase (NADP(+)) [Acinetobacter bereziniae]
MSFKPQGKHLIAGQWVATEQTFVSQPIEGPTYHFSVGNIELVNQACEAAEDAFWSYGYSTIEQRALFLNTIADEIEVRADAITEIAKQETGLPIARLQGERGRTVGQLRLFAAHILKKDFLDRCHDVALPERQPLPRPELRLIQRPIGPVVVFGASNFPLAFSTAGGDTASALAAGCPVIVKGHEAHPGTGEIIAEAIHHAVQKCGLHQGVFNFVQGGTYEIGQALVQHPLIKAVGFTGSLRGGRALFDLCVTRPEPIPFFGELGSINPMFILPSAIENRGEDIAKAWADSLTLGAGQFCTNPGVVVLIEGELTQLFIQTATTMLSSIKSQTMLSKHIAACYHTAVKRFAETQGLNQCLIASEEIRQASPSMFTTTGQEWLKNIDLAEEVFGPLGLIVVVKNEQEMMQIAKSLQGQITCTIHLDEKDKSLAKMLLPVLERKAGRILVNGMPTGVEVCDAMVHGGPYPASTNFGATSVGTMAIRRFLRPVSYQNIPEDMLPNDYL